MADRVVLLDNEYGWETLGDVERDVYEAFDPEFSCGAALLPEEAEGVYRVRIEYIGTDVAKEGKKSVLQERNGRPYFLFGYEGESDRSGTVMEVQDVQRDYFEGWCIHGAWGIKLDHKGNALPDYRQVMHLKGAKLLKWLTKEEAHSLVPGCAQEVK